jgi:hypothetical protein
VQAQLSSSATRSTFELHDQREHDEITMTIASGLAYVGVEAGESRHQMYLFVGDNTTELGLGSYSYKEGRWHGGLKMALSEKGTPILMLDTSHYAAQPELRLPVSRRVPPPRLPGARPRDRALRPRPGGVARGEQGRGARWSTG